MHLTKRKRAVWKRLLTYCTIPTLGYSEKGKLWRQSKRWVVSRGYREGRDEDYLGFLGQWNSFYDATMGVPVITHLSKPIEGTEPRVNPDGNSGLWLMCQCKFISCKLWWATTTSTVRRLWVCGWGAYGNSTPSAQFCAPKTALKIKFTNNNNKASNTWETLIMAHDLSLKCILCSPEVS